MGRDKGIPSNVTEFYSTFFQVLLALAFSSLRKELKPRTSNPDSKTGQGLTNSELGSYWIFSLQLEHWVAVNYG